MFSLVALNCSLLGKMPPFCTDVWAACIPPACVSLSLNLGVNKQKHAHTHTHTHTHKWTTQQHKSNKWERSQDKHSESQLELALLSPAPMKRAPCRACARVRPSACQRMNGSPWLRSLTAEVALRESTLETIVRTTLYSCGMRVDIIAVADSVTIRTPTASPSPPLPPPPPPKKQKKKKNQEKKKKKKKKKKERKREKKNWSGAAERRAPGTPRGSVGLWALWGWAVNLDFGAPTASKNGGGDRQCGMRRL